MTGGRTVVNVVRMNPNKRGPVELQLVETCRSWTARGGRFACWFTDAAPEWYREVVESAGGTLGVLGDVGDQGSWDSEVLRVATAEDADLVHLHFAAPTVARALAADGRAVVVTEHMELYPKRLAPLRRVPRFLRQRHVDAFIAVSAFVGVQTRREHLARSGKVHVVLNGVDLDHFRPRPEERQGLREHLLGVLDDRVVITVAAHLIPRKRQALLVRALPELVRHDPRTLVVIAGAGPDERSLRALVTELGLADNVRLLTGDNDVAALYAASDVAVLVSEREALGGSAVEAMACGIPVVTSRVGGLQEVAEDGVSGVLVDDTTPAGLASALRPLVADAELRARMGAAGRLRAETVFDLVAAGAATCGLYSALLPDRSPGDRPT